MKRQLPDTQRSKPHLISTDTLSFNATYELERVIDTSAAADAGGPLGDMRLHVVGTDPKAIYLEHMLPPG